ncbi:MULTISPECIES: MBL fold metallo-hydrolase [Streptomyces]|uniref:MBL fold metallo-hydrolase n=1 Tax=Streptomyces virginiae TaxID=1961 RepID=A0ABQ3NHF4_STRVG|nr:MULTISPECIES: MBL fold metallo-hydrolase [Streptomyces]KOU22048.1 beta-lactamase [Streptomyces sp. WM6349]KOU98721.1 beta-lactamase [Streptomyces sp. XY533]KOV00575.1 beta-lactamase [Streptomyces sp. XY511]KOV45894.1 beta-lactamase [Streptomyces sp. H036]MBP2347443.1 L-ascorbate metabolism protein UlaG (beta-lactamase superfamily) [Streptomyces virginiae]
MKLTKRLHSCVQLEKDGRTLVIDPGAFSEPDAGLGADALLVTHEHPDHFDEGRLRAALDANPAAGLWTLRSVAERLAPAYPGRVHTVGHGDTFTAAGFEVQVHGELHAVIHPDIPRVTNVGYLVDGSLFHPGDALTVPGVPVETLMVPVHAPWNKVSEVIDYLREVKPRRALDIHDAYLADIARPIYDFALDKLGGTDHGRLTAGDSAEL